MTLEQALVESIDYNPETGELHWKMKRPRSHFLEDRTQRAWHNRWAGRAITCRTQGYSFIRITVRGEKYNVRGHRAAWLITHGEWPKFIDHINHVRDDNRLSNLRNVTRRENNKNKLRRSNNTTGVTGVSPHFDRWVARIHNGEKYEHLGVFKTIKAAASARRAAEDRLGYRSMA